MSTKVNFYLLKQQDEESRQLFACRLAEKLWHRGLPLQLYTDSEAEAGELDRLLWTFAADSFIPHALYCGETTPGRIEISWGTSLPSGGNLLNLSSRMPPDCRQFSTIAEFVLREDNSLSLSRQLWGQYRKSGCELQHHEI